MFIILIAFFTNGSVHFLAVVKDVQLHVGGGHLLDTDNYWAATNAATVNDIFV